MSQFVVLDTPIEKPQPTIYYTKYIIVSVDIILNSKANIRVILYNDDQTSSDDRTYTMEGDDYALWKDDDSYVTKWVHDKIVPPPVIPVDPIVPDALNT